MLRLTSLVHSGLLSKVSVFVVLIFVYVLLMNRLDRRYGFDEDDE